MKKKSTGAMTSIKAFRRALPLIALLVSAAACSGGSDPEATSSSEIALTIAAGNLSMNAGESVQIHATVSTSAARLYTLKYTSADPKVASVSVDGLVKAVAGGNTEISVVATLLDTGTTASAKAVITVAGAGAADAGAEAGSTDPMAMPVKIDLSKIPVGNPGVGVDQLIPTTEQPAPSDIGAFRTGCSYTHMKFDDPIVFPGQPGKSHLHTFFGNTLTDANSTATSIATTGNSTCRGGTINRTAYWVPTMVDTKDGTPLTPMGESNFYYKTGYALPSTVITAMPNGLRMIAGDPKGTPGSPNGVASYACIWDGGNGNWQPSIPDCPVIGTSWLIMGIDFPQCWDGVNLDSPNHKSHMAAPVNVLANNTGNCPATHPVAIPAIAFQILYQVTEPGSTKRWRLSSDNYDLSQPAGYSGHGDWFNGWKKEIVDVWVKKCDQEKKDCHSHLLGDGRAMVIP